MHWADARNFDFDAALDRARHHYEEEREEENSTDRLPEAVQELIDALERKFTTDIWLVSFMDYDLWYFDLETRVLEPLDNPFGPRLLPM